MHGRGTFSTPKGATYIGEFKNGEKHGEGTLTSQIGNKYIGKYKNGEFWNISILDIDGELIGKIINGEKL